MFFPWGVLDDGALSISAQVSALLCVHVQKSWWFLVGSMFFSLLLHDCAVMLGRGGSSPGNLSAACHVAEPPCCVMAGSQPDYSLWTARWPIVRLFIQFSAAPALDTFPECLHSFFFLFFFFFKLLCCFPVRAYRRANHNGKESADHDNYGIIFMGSGFFDSWPHSWQLFVYSEVSMVTHI